MPAPILTIATITPPAGSLGWLPVALAAALAAAAAWAFHRLRGTTLAAPAAWAVVAALTIAAVEAFLALQPDLENRLPSSLLRYAAAAGTFCPMMAVLGAKRPQDRGWQWVVAALWITLFVPAGQALASSTGDRLELFFAWRLMIYALIVMGLLNYLLTRNALPAILVAVAQACFLASYLLESPPGYPRLRVTLGLSLMLLAVVLAGMMSLRGQPRSPHASAPPASSLQPPACLAPLTARWLAFRNAWGAFWALRIMHRTNQTADLAHWPVRLHWHGFTPSSSPTDGHDGQSAESIDPSQKVQIEETLSTLLRRFEIGKRRA